MHNNADKEVISEVAILATLCVLRKRGLLTEKQADEIFRDIDNFNAEFSHFFQNGLAKRKTSAAITGQIGES